MLNIEEFKNTLNTLGASRVPFLFMVDFEMQKPLVFKLDEIDKKSILFNINGYTNVEDAHEPATVPALKKNPITLAQYKQKFDIVYDRLCYGDSYLTNLTVQTPIDNNNSFNVLFHKSKARYKLLYNNQFLVFSPETFIQIEDAKIFSHPMKGTIDASVPDAKARILNNPKEIAEHVTIVDLIRNDLSQISSHVTVTRFRYVDEIKTNTKNLLQVSSEIVGELKQNYLEELGTIIVSLLPAGSISGAPKAKTLDIIAAAEKQKRGYYTGVFGYFDGNKLDSGVMIRYIENINGNYFYRSGGGITTLSNVESEYQELIDKVYVPLT
jgi:para-aminobenzoate synthetase component 1